jgi:hypothetical protein
MSGQTFGEKLAVPVPQALGAREFMIERLILVSFDENNYFDFESIQYREIIHVNYYIKMVEKRKLKMIYLN